VDSAFFELDPSDDLDGNHHGRAQITVSSHDPQISTPTAHTGLLGTKLEPERRLSVGRWAVEDVSRSRRPLRSSRR
jgi:hypothetical protein